MPTEPEACMSNVPGLPSLMEAVSILSIISWPWYICCERPEYLGAAGAAAVAAVSVFDESQAARPRATKRPAARITLRMDILPDSWCPGGCARMRLRRKLEFGPMLAAGSALV